MADSAVASDFFQSLDVQLNLSSEITFYHLGRVDDFTDLLYFLTCQISYTGIRIHTCFC